MTTQEIYQEIQGLIKLLKKEGKGAYLSKTLCEKMYDTVSSDLEILEEIDTDLEFFISDNRRQLSFDLKLKIDHIQFEIGRIPSILYKRERYASPQAVKQ